MFSSQFIGQPSLYSLAGIAANHGADSVDLGPLLNLESQECLEATTSFVTIAGGGD
jgi:hypothetical protein